MAIDTPVALVTGASTGIGRAAASALVEAGYRVVGTSRRAAEVAPLAGVTFVDLDVADDESAADAVGWVIERFGRIDVLVNNADVGSAGAAEERSLAQDRHVFEVNVFGMLRMTKAVLPHMRARGAGRIINVSSVLGLIPAPYGAVYAASKHAMEGYSESLDHEVRRYGVRVLLVEPAYTKTGFDSGITEPDAPLPAYATQRRVAAEVLSAGISNGDDPAVVARVIVKAATDPKPKTRYTAGPTAAQISSLRRIAPSRLFDRQIRKANKLAG
jgi:NAD(P)-dependent dehydrogenase (short-subunit alcohol dehydrogenase family)